MLTLIRLIYDVPACNRPDPPDSVSSPDGHDLPRLINELVPGLATKRDDFVIGLGYHVGYKSRAKLEDPFKRENSSGVDQLRRFLRFLTLHRRRSQRLCHFEEALA
jgi:hypothetical protein